MIRLEGKRKLLRVFIGELDKHEGKPLYETIVMAARENGLAGATVVRGIMSFGASSVFHKTKILALSSDLPIIIEIADFSEKIDAFLPIINQIFTESNCGGMITIENVDVIRYRNPEKED